MKILLITYFLVNLLMANQWVAPVDEKGECSAPAISCKNISFNIGEHTMPAKQNLTGKRFGRLTVMYEVEPHIQPSGKRTTKYYCKCDCGNKVSVTLDNLNNGHTRSCGCLRKEKLTKHGYSKNSKESHPLYRVWADIKTRCYNKNSNSYKYYGARGIKMCNEWKESPKDFINWGFFHGWKKGLEVDRINNNGNYEPSNCRFITRRENNLNQRLLRINNKSGYRGVSWCKAINKWVARITINYEVIYLGYFIDKKEAAKSYNNEAIKHGYPLNKV